MFRRVSLAALFLLLMSSLAVVAGQDSANDKDKKVLQGNWEFVSFLVEGQDSMPKKEAGWNFFFRFDGDNIIHDKWSKDGSGEFFHNVQFTLDATKVPKWIDSSFRWTKVGRDYTGAPGIYELKGDELRICAGKNRPTEFSSTEKNGQMLIVAKRVK